LIGNAGNGEHKKLPILGSGNAVLEVQEGPEDL